VRDINSVCRNSDGLSHENYDTCPGGKKANHIVMFVPVVTLVVVSCTVAVYLFA
jgi:hypothetical protein